MTSPVPGTHHVISTEASVVYNFSKNTQINIFKGNCSNKSTSLFSAVA